MNQRWIIIKKHINKRGINILTTFIYVLMFIIIVIIGANLVRTVTVTNFMSSDKIRFGNEKSQIYSLIDKHSTHIVKGSVITEEKLRTVPVNVKNNYEYKDSTLKYTVSTTEDNGGDVTVKTTKVKFEETVDGLMYKYVDEVKKPDGTVVVQEEKELTFGSITDIKFDYINKICTDDTIATGCINVTGLLDISLYGEIEFMGRLSLNKSKRSFFFENQ